MNLGQVLTEKNRNGRLSLEEFTEVLAKDLREGMLPGESAEDIDAYLKRDDSRAWIKRSYQKGCERYQISHDNRHAFISVFSGLEYAMSLDYPGTTIFDK